MGIKLTPAQAKVIDTLADGAIVHAIHPTTRRTLIAAQLIRMEGARWALSEMGEVLGAERRQRRTCLPIDAAWTAAHLDAQDMAIAEYNAQAQERQEATLPSGRLPGAVVVATNIAKRKGWSLMKLITRYQRTMPRPIVEQLIEWLIVPKCRECAYKGGRQVFEGHCSASCQEEAPRAYTDTELRHRAGV